MRTGLIDSWTKDPAGMGPTYPGVGWEVGLLVLCLLLWLVWTAWQMRHENERYDRESETLKAPEPLARAVAQSVGGAREQG